ncbi:hypothetical protein [Allopusillimonas ginsengisoli]|uniref:hypothetical protein n=1 Tax=Allopusillimonas ginsengisoli TaxID=453575 RepID=UPI0010202C54|nr:hypothetical protein [Allopusillimonas ginsengisoli]TEA79488.1 hypothetical protein ERE07_00560 [Allopusillimonas ginsengisoli]
MPAKSGEKNRRGGRPKSDMPRDKFLKVRLSANELKTLDHRLTQSGYTRSEAVRLLVLHERLPEKIHAGLDVSASQAYVKLQPLQSNLNQIAAHLNRVKPLEMSRSDLETIYKNTRVCESLLRKLRAEILTKSA